ncbi:MAG: preprotein translocase subunit SecE [Planctomycetaceae bacterium]|nr:preprotein translocase subunit SecE [Planctomycetaceae bacterium]
MSQTEANSGFLNELFSFRVHKRTQGKLVRQVTLYAIAGVVAVGAYTLSQSWLLDQSRGVQIGIPVVLTLLGAWIAFRAVNYLPFAEFLISVEAEMERVSWAGKDELYRATMVVIGMMMMMGVVLYSYDMIWYQILRSIGVLQVGG